MGKIKKTDIHEGLSITSFLDLFAHVHKGNYAKERRYKVERRAYAKLARY